MPHNLEQTADEFLMSALCRRETDAFAVLYDRYGPRMYRYFYRMLWRDGAKAEDFTQDLFLKVLEKAQQFQPGASFKTWLYTLASNMCKNEFRRLEYRQSFPARPMETFDEFLPETIDRQLFETRLRQAIDQLEAPQRQCFVLRYQEELSVREISEILQCPEGTVKSRLHHALRKLGSRMELYKM